MSRPLHTRTVGDVGARSQKTPGYPIGRHSASAGLVPLRGDFYVFDPAGRRWNRKPIFAHTFEVELHGFSDLDLDFSDGCTRRDATR